MRALTVLVLRLAILSIAAAPRLASAQFPVLYTWPGPFPCDTTLQACVSAAGPDDGIDIATNGPINESITRSGSLDLRAAPGFEPAFFGHVTVTAAAGAGAQLVYLQGLTMMGGRIVVGNITAETLTARIVGNTLVGSTASSVLDVYSTGTGPLDFLISGNHLEPDLGPSSAIRVRVQDGYGGGDVVGNTVEMSGHPDATGIRVEVQDGSLLADVIRNQVVGSGFENGILVSFDGNGSLDARVMDNLAAGANAGGVGIAVAGNIDVATITARIVNNTASGNTYGLWAYGTDVVVANNVTASNFVGLEVLSQGVSNHHNLFFDNDLDVEFGDAGPGSVFGDPRFAGAADFRLAAGSPAIDAGDSAAVPPELTTDLAGDPRLQGEAVDIGAYEAPEPRARASAIAALLALGACGGARRSGGAASAATPPHRS